MTNHDEADDAEVARVAAEVCERRKGLLDRLATSERHEMTESAGVMRQLWEIAKRVPTEFPEIVADRADHFVMAAHRPSGPECRNHWGSPKPAAPCDDFMAAAERRARRREQFGWKP